MNYAAHASPRWKSYDEEGFLRWVAEHPVTKVTSVGPTAGDDIICCELHQQLADGAWRSAVVPYHFIQMGGIATFHVQRCGLVHVRERNIRSMEAKDREAGKVTDIAECPCCGNLYYRASDPGAAEVG